MTGWYEPVVRLLHWSVPRILCDAYTLVWFECFDPGLAITPKFGFFPRAFLRVSECGLQLQKS